MSQYALVEVRETGSIITMKAVSEPTVPAMQKGPALEEDQGREGGGDKALEESHSLFQGKLPAVERKNKVHTCSGDLQKNVCPW